MKAYLDEQGNRFHQCSMNFEQRYQDQYNENNGKLIYVGSLSREN